MRVCGRRRRAGGWVAFLVAASASGVVLTPRSVQASGHGPVYGLATPTLGQGGWSVDLALMGRLGSRDVAMMRPMLSYGVTPDLQVSLSLPLPLSVPPDVRPSRTMAMMPASRDVEILAGWRFHRQAPAIGARFESTAYAGVVLPTDAARSGVDTAPGLYAALVTGYASRGVYAWAGGLFRRYAATAGPDSDRVGDLVMYSLVLGYRPPRFRKDLPHADWRLFVELIGEHTRRDRVAGVERPDTGGHQVFVGPTLLGLYGDWGVSGGPVFRVYDSQQRRGDSVRLVVNFTRWF